MRLLVWCAIWRNVHGELRRALPGRAGHVRRTRDAVRHLERLHVDVRMVLVDRHLDAKRDGRCLRAERDEERARANVVDDRDLVRTDIDEWMLERQRLRAGCRSAVSSLRRARWRC